MYLLLVKLGVFFCLVTATSSESANSVLLKFRTDVNKVGKDLENLIFHVIQKVVDDISVYQVNGDYSNDEDTIEETTTQHSVTKKILEDALENTTEDYTTRQFTIQPQKEESIQNRLKRSFDNTTDPVKPSEAVEVMVNSSVINKTCTTNSADQDSLEFQHIYELKEEIKKLQDLVVLLRDQQKMISLLDNTKSFDTDVSSRIGDRDLLKVLEYVNNKDKHLEDHKNSTKSNHHQRSTFEELATIKEDLKQAIEALNKTRTGLIMEIRKENLLEKELSDQKLDLSFLKIVVEKLMKNHVNPDRDDGGDILGVIQHIPKQLPSHNLGKTIEKGLEVHKILREPNPSSNTARSSGLDDLERLVRRLNKPKDIESRMFELQRDIDRQKQENDVMKQLEFLQKYFELQKKHPVITSEMLKKLQLATKTTTETKSRDLDEGIEAELQKLQEAIDDLKHKDQVESSSDFTFDEPEDDKKQFEKILKMMLHQYAKENDESNSFQGMLKKMMHQESKKDDTAKQLQVMMDKMNTQGKKGMFNSMDTKENNVLLKEIIELRKQLASFEKQNSKDVYSGQGGYISGYGKNPQQTEFTAEDLANLYQNYDKYKKHMQGQMVNNHQFTPMYQKNYQSTSTNGYYEVPNPYQSSYPQPVPPNRNFGGNLEHQNIPFTISVPPNNFWMEAYPKPVNSEPTTNHLDNPSGYSHFQTHSNGQDAFHQDRNQFFPVPQSFYPRPSSEPFHPANTAYGVGAEQPGDHPPKAGEEVGYIYQKVEDLKAQIYNLQNIIDGFNKPNYTQTPQDRETVASLEKQINELKSIINSMNPDTPPNYSSFASEVDPNSITPEHQPSYPPKSRRRRTVDQDTHLFDQAVLGLKNLIFQKENVVGSKNNYDDIQRRINDLKYQLESHLHPKKKPHFSYLSTPSTYQPPYYQHNNFEFSPPKIQGFEVFKPKKNDLFTSVVLKILDKVLAATPAVLERLFGYGFRDLSYSELSSGYNDQNELQKLFKSLGFFGYGPLIVLKLIDGFSTFVKILRKNEFFRNFLTPALVLLFVAGAVVFLVWWLQPSDSYVDVPGIDNGGYYNSNNYQFSRPYANYGYGGKGYGNNDYNYGYRGSNKRPVYGGSYFEDGKQRNSLY